MPEYQLTLGLPHQPSLGRADFLPGDANRQALRLIEAWPDWPGGTVLLSGPAGSGKTHLTAIWAAASGAPEIEAPRLTAADAERLEPGGAMAVENIDAPGLDQTALFHLLNRARERVAWVLMTARDPGAATSMDLPDLASRLRAAQPASLLAPDDALLASVLVKLFSDRQVVVQPEVVAYIVKRMERSFDAARRTVEKLDQAALAIRRPITRSLAAGVLRDWFGVSDDAESPPEGWTKSS